MKIEKKRTETGIGSYNHYAYEQTGAVERQPTSGGNKRPEHRGSV